MKNMPSYAFKQKEYNQTSAQKVHKYTVNIPLKMWDELKKRTEAGNEIRRVSIYIVAVLNNHLRNEKPLDSDILIDAKRFSDRVASAELRREHLDEIEMRKQSFIKIAIDSARNLFQPKQQIFNFNRK